MISDKFSNNAFNSAGKAESDNLAKLLEQEILIEIDGAIQEKLFAIIGELNSLGHNLRLYFEPKMGEINYRDFMDDSGDYFKLRISVDFMVDVGYQDAVVLKSEDDYEEDIDQLCQRLRTMNKEKS